MIKTPAEVIKDASHQTKCISAETAASMLLASDQVLLIDVREPTEITNTACIEMAINIPRGVLEMKINEVCAHADTTILIHCATGGRATLSAVALQNMGYKNIHVISANFDDIHHHIQNG